ncbi:hypothetical protein [Flavobacterium reichenbachii]|uniref:Uncharacterized protein n=1 Tax=Flavobacterium reichenbachii TaxID=362418 RepID=A0A085ZIV1_9FLAO|nr:hypothetical protein [Flavobacterium reichenbachii]KFF04365.1 hypothetical protein IW19_01960 [Flavobacterium reichenbachii]OXB11644.1 hypothetical protein B0A68_20600 [Flavobacterium reichenbachii]
MEENLKIYEKTIKKKHSFASPKFTEEFRTALSKTVFIPIAEKTISKLDWDIVYKNENSIEAKRKVSSFGLDQYTETVTITYNHGNVEVKSESLGSEIWDNGRNSKRARLFIYAFKETEAEFDKEALNELERETEKKNNWDDYIVPEDLPQPNEVKKKNFSILLIGGLFISLLLGFIVAELSVHFIYFIGVYEVLVGIAISLLLKHVIKLSNFTEIPKIQYLLMGMVFLTYLSNQYFQMEIILSENNYERISFFEFLKIRLEEGLTIKTLNTGWIGMIISWILQLVLTYYVAFLRVLSVVTTYQLERIPVEVLDFSTYHFIKGKSEVEVRNELSQKGWATIENQDEVFEALGAVYGKIELIRLK